MVIAGIALILAVWTEFRVRAIANLQFDEKLAMMAGYLGSELNRVEYDLRAVSNLRYFASCRRKKALINTWIIPFVRRCVTQSFYEEDANTLENIIDIALRYGIHTGTLNELKQQIQRKS